MARTLPSSRQWFRCKHADRMSAPYWTGYESDLRVELVGALAGQIIRQATVFGILTT